MPKVFKQWPLACSGCGWQDKVLAWDDEVPEKCPECGGQLWQESFGYERAPGVVGDEIPGGMIMEHVEPGRRVDSKSELRKVLASHGYMLNDTKSEEGFARVRKEARERAYDTRER